MKRSNSEPRPIARKERETRMLRVALGSCVIALAAVAFVGVAFVIRANSEPASPAMSGSVITFNQRVEVLSVNEKVKTMEVRTLPIDGSFTVAEGTLPEGATGNVCYDGARMDSLAPLPGDDLVVSWQDSSNAQTQFPLHVSEINTTTTFYAQLENWDLYAQNNNGENSSSLAAFPEEATDNEQNRQLEGMGVFTCNLVLEVTSFDTDARLAGVRVKGAQKRELEGAPYVIPQGTQGTIALTVCNWRYGHDPEVGQDLITSWIAVGPALSQTPGSIRSAGDFWYETGRPWPQSWLTAAADGALTRAMVTETPLEDLLAAQESADRQQGEAAKRTGDEAAAQDALDSR